MQSSLGSCTVLAGSCPSFASASRLRNRQLSRMTLVTAEPTVGDGYVSVVRFGESLR